MYATVRPLLELCIMKRGPQDLPASPAWLAAMALGYVAVGVAMGLPVYATGVAVAAAGFDLLLLLGFAAALLAWRGHPARWLQTATALTGAGFLMGVVALPIVFSIYRAILGEADATLAVLAYWVLVGWIIAIYGYIFTQALSLRSRWFGLGVALGYFVLSWVTVQTVFPQGQL
jgi:hypothetical protein